MTETTLTPQQTQRAEALRAATSILSGDVVAGLMRPNVIKQVGSLVYAAEWILDGPQDDDSDEHGDGDE